MVFYCCVIGCHSNSNIKKKDPNSILSFHAFPSCPELKSKWLRAIGRPNWTPSGRARVCSVHFNHNQITFGGCRVRLKDDVVPVNLLPSNSNFEASHVEACRICLAIDVKMNSLLDPVLGACMETVFERNTNFNIGGLPQFVCYQCTPNLIKSSEIIEKCITSQATLLDIFAKNGQVTKNLIKEHGQPELKSSPNNSMLTKIISHLNVKTESNYSDVTHLKNENIESIKLELQDVEINKYKIDIKGKELSVIDNNESSSASSVEDVIPDNDFNEDSRSNALHRKKVNNVVKHIKKVARTKKQRLTPDETDMLKYFNIVELSLQEQIQEWEKNTVRRPLKSETVYRCEVCNKIFANANTYHVHTTYHDTSQGEAECSVCKLRFKSAALAASHSKRAHSKKFFCKVCPKAFNNVGVAKKHQRWHSGHVYKCVLCPFGSVHESALGAHRARAHSAARAHACTICGQAFTSVRGRDIHTHTKHRFIKEEDITNKYRCEQCDIGFATENARHVHILTSIQHANNPDLCGIIKDSDFQKCCKKCGKECGSFKELVQHNRAAHSRGGGAAQSRREEAPYPISCELCGETISTRRKHWLHVRKHHPKEVNTYQPVITAVCDTCGKGFQNTTKLHLHKLRHRSPTVRCQLCPRMFYDKYALMRHAGTHNADKPHQCRICGRAFKVLSNLYRHARVHTDTASYECTICGKKFKHSSSVNLHVRTVHYKLPPPPRKRRSKSAKDESDV